MNKSRLEAFSDGVFAIVITLLILNIRLPDVDYKHLNSALFNLLPKIIAYFMSFIIIGLYWISHHNSFRLIKKTDGAMLWMNLLLLLFVSFLPFPTALIGEYPFSEVPLKIYGLNLLLANATGFGMIFYLAHNPHLAVDDYLEVYYKKQLKFYSKINAMYILAIILTFFSPLTSFLIYIFVLVYVIQYHVRWIK